MLHVLPAVYLQPCEIVPPFLLWSRKGALAVELLCWPHCDGSHALQTCQL